MTTMLDFTHIELYRHAESFRGENYYVSGGKKAVGDAVYPVTEYRATKCRKWKWQSFRYKVVIPRENGKGESFVES